MEIRVVTTSWSDTKKLEEILSFALKELELRADIAFVMGERTAEACMARPPALIVDGKVLFEGMIPRLDELKEKLAGQKSG